MQYALIAYDLQLILALMGQAPGGPKGKPAARLKLKAQETVVWSMWRGKHEATVMLAHKYAWTA
jgi:hypothetical protein